MLQKIKVLFFALLVLWPENYIHPILYITTEKAIEFLLSEARTVIFIFSQIYPLE